MAYGSKGNSTNLLIRRGRAAIFLLCAVLLALTAACSSSKDDVGDLADSLENRLTDALRFDNSEIEEGEAPAGKTGAKAPQIEEATSPPLLHEGLDFSVWLVSTYSQPADLTRAIVRVKGATRHIVIKTAFSALGAKWQMSLFGNLNKDAKLTGKDFEIEYALQTKDGLTGAYVTKKLKVADTEPECSEGLCCNGGQWIEKDAQCLKNDNLACTEQACNAQHECVATLLPETCLIADTCYIPYDLNPENECEKCWPEESTEAWVYYNSAACDAGDGPESGYCNDGVCLPLAVDGDFEAAEADGDVESDGDAESESETESDSETIAVWNDEQSGLGWELDAPQEGMNLNDCATRCSELAIDGLNGWHIPTITELRSLIRNCDATVSGGSCTVSDDCAASGECRDETCDGCGGDIACYTVDELAEACGIYQAATLDDDDGTYIWSIDFNTGSINNVLWSELHLCRCVLTVAR